MALRKGEIQLLFIAYAFLSEIKNCAKLLSWPEEPDWTGSG